VLNAGLDKTVVVRLVVVFTTISPSLIPSDKNDAAESIKRAVGDGAVTEVTAPLASSFG